MYFKSAEVLTLKMEHGGWKTFFKKFPSLLVVEKIFSNKLQKILFKKITYLVLGQFCLKIFFTKSTPLLALLFVIGNFFNDHAFCKQHFLNDQLNRGFCREYFFNSQQRRRFCEDKFVRRPTTVLSIYSIYPRQMYIKFQFLYK